MDDVAAVGMTGVLSRLRRMSRHELAWRATAAAKTTAQRVSIGLRPSRWDPSQIRRTLQADVTTSSLRQALANGRWDDVHAQLLEQIRRRGARFPLDPASAPRLRAVVAQRWPGAVTDAATRSEAILAGRYDLLGHHALMCASADGLVDWHRDPVRGVRAPRRFWADVPFLDPSIGDHKVIWELNRHQHWLQLGRALWLTGDSRYSRRILQELDDWMATNPPYMGINWASMLELGFRAMSWVWGLHFLAGAEEFDQSERGGADSGFERPNRGPSWLVDMLVALDRQLTHVETNLSIYFSPNTHLTGEALALYVTGIALPELANSRRWRDTGRRILLEAIDRQIHEDGGHVERSTHYHRYTLDFYLMATLMARSDGDVEAEERFTDATMGLARFARTIADSSGRLPMIGDDDGGMLWPLAGRPSHDVRDSLAMAAALLDRPDFAPWGMQEEACWILGPGSSVEGEAGRAPRSEPARSLPSCLLPATGYVVMRDAAGSHAVFDVGQHGYLNAGHAHADALSLTLSLEGRPLLLDPGTATYTVDARIRDRFRSSLSHNTLTIDGTSQAQPNGPFQWRSWANATLHAWRTHPQIDWAEGSHDGYAPVRHRRTVLRTLASGWLVIDEVLGTGTHEAAAHWHFDPHWTPRLEGPGCLRTTHSDGTEAWVLYDAGNGSLAWGDTISKLGWYAPSYGVIEPTWSARVVSKRPAPAAMITWFGTQPASGTAPTLHRLSHGGEARSGAIGVLLRRGPRTSTFILEPTATGSHARDACELNGLCTDARVLHCVDDDEVMVRLDLFDVTHALTPRRGLRLVCSEPVPDLHVAIEDGVLDLQASRPPAELLIQGTLLRSVCAIRLNQQESRGGIHPAHALTVPRDEWTTPVCDLLPSTA